MFTRLFMSCFQIKQPLLSTVRHLYTSKHNNVLPNYFSSCFAEAIMLFFVQIRQTLLSLVTHFITSKHKYMFCHIIFLTCVTKQSSITKHGR